jgi:hypothetical protein
MLPRPFLQVDCDDDGHQWCLTFDGGRAVCLSFDWHGDNESDDGIIAAEISDPRQVAAIIERIRHHDGNDAHTLAVEIFDLLLTLSPMKPAESCSEFLVWRLREWINDNRRAEWEDQSAA